MLVDTPEIQVIGEAESGEQAIELARLHQPDVVLLDVNMPGIGGVETTRRLLQSVPSAKVLAVSGLSEEPYPSLLLKAGASGYITNPDRMALIAAANREPLPGKLRCQK